MSMSDLLVGCPLFLELYEKEVEKIASTCSVFTFEAGEFIVKDGDRGQEIYVVLDGKAIVQKESKLGTIKIQPLLKGDVFGEMVLVDENIRSADILADQRCSVLEISYESIFQLFKSDPKVFGLLQLNLSRLIAKRLRASNEIIKEIREKLL